MPSLACIKSIYTLDLPGYGESDKPDIEYALSLYTYYIAHFIDSSVRILKQSTGPCRRFYRKYKIKF
jgi:pimeloyl-ACP methyl ester carboxylesterase